MSFNKQDVLTVAHALVQGAIQFDDRGYGEYECEYCFGSIEKYDKSRKFPHELDCPVLVAQDLLTGENNYE